MIEEFTIIRCDRCKKEIKRKVNWLFVLSVLLWNIDIREPIINQKRKSIELCRKCSNELKVWLKGG